MIAHPYNTRANLIAFLLYYFIEPLATHGSSVYLDLSRRKAQQDKKRAVFACAVYLFDTSGGDDQRQTCFADVTRVTLERQHALAGRHGFGYDKGK